VPFEEKYIKTVGYMNLSLERLWKKEEFAVQNMP